MSQPEFLSNHLNCTIAEAPPPFICQQRYGAEKPAHKIASQETESLPDTPPEWSLFVGRCGEGRHKESYVVAAGTAASREKFPGNQERDQRFRQVSRPAADARVTF